VKILKLLNNKNVKIGSYNIGLTAIIIAILLAVNLVVQALPTKYTKLDLSDEQLYTIGDQTNELLNGLEEDITLYHIVESGAEDSTITNLLESYRDTSKHITVETKDPVVYPNFTSQYTDEEVENNSVIVVGENKSKVLAYSTIYESRVDYTTYSTTTTGFDGEGQITSAISYVTSDDLPILYVLEGHNEAALSSTLTASIEKENIEIQSLNLLTEESVPEDAACLFVNSPTKDLSAEEAEKIIAYLEAGNNAFLGSSYTEEDLPNYAS